MKIISKIHEINHIVYELVEPTSNRMRNSLIKTRQEFKHNKTWSIRTKVSLRDIKHVRKASSESVSASTRDDQEKYWEIKSYQTKPIQEDN